MRLNGNFLALVALCVGGAIAVLLVLARSPNGAASRSRPNEPMVDHGPVGNTNNKMIGLIHALQVFEYETGRAPSSSRDAYHKAPQNYDEERVRDAWGSDLRMVVSDDSIRLHSAGADGLFDTSDDMSAAASRELPEELKRSTAH